MTQEDKLLEIKQRFSIIGNDELLNRALLRAYKVAATDLSVLVIGESGVGKEHFPKVIHNYSLRKNKPLIAINCGSIPNGTIDSELFGHVKGSFTGAIADHKGYFEVADGGTIFLDEVGELPLETQVRLLRVLETGEFIRVGDSIPKKTNVRVVAATNINMEEAIKAGRFREDLYYRLATITIQVPALRERKNDIPLLFRKFVRDFSERYNMPVVKLNDDATEVLKNYYFRGNIRQLKNIAEQICVLEQSRDITVATLREYLPIEGLARIVGGGTAEHTINNETLLQMVLSIKMELEQLKQVVATMPTQPQNSSDLQPPIRVKTDTSIIAPAHPTTPDIIINPAPIEDAQPINNIDNHKNKYAIVEDVTVIPISNDGSSKTEKVIPMTIQDKEKEIIQEALIRNKGNRKAAAAELNISERSIYRKIKEYGLVQTK